MSEAKLILKSSRPVTKSSLVSDLDKLNLKGELVIVHSSLSSLGWVCGGAVALIEALQEVIGQNGTLVMPAHSGDHSEPKYWENPPVPKEWHEIIRKEMPPFRKEVTPTRGIGAAAELFRSFPNVLRSDHPCLSFTAWGNRAEEITAEHKLDYALGENSPLKTIYDLDGKILLLGADHCSNTSLHLAEYLADHNVRIKIFGSSIIKDGKKKWQKYQDIEFNDQFFSEIAKEYEKENTYMTAEVGQTQAKLFSQRSMVDFAVEWFEENHQS